MAMRHALSTSLWPLPVAHGRLGQSTDNERPDGHQTATAADEGLTSIAVRVIVDLKPASVCK